jgi:hypothetical protein
LNSPVLNLIGKNPDNTQSLLDMALRINIPQPQIRQRRDTSLLDTLRGDLRAFNRQRDSKPMGGSKPSYIASNVNRTTPTQPTNVMNLYREWDRTNPKLKAFYDAAREEVKRRYGYDIGVSETWRPKERQEYLYSLGRTRPGNIVTWTKNSRHTLGNAIDILPPKGVNQQELITLLRGIADANNIGYLGDRDPFHYQL